MPWGLEAVEQLVLPAECLLCQALFPFRDADRLVCDVCRHRWRPVRAPWCDRCGQPEPSFGGCRLCIGWPAALQCVRSAVWLDAGARAAVHALKYGGLPRIADDLATAMTGMDLPGRESAWLVPVPLGPKRLWQRGYNQSERLARALSRHWRRPVVDLLSRARETATQTALTPEARLANVAGAFQMRIADFGLRIESEGDQSAIRNRKSAITRTLVLVDDVFTTGATLAEAARALELGGATTVAAVTFGRAALPDFT
ncbi:MAG TPA: double zinc ribbon domain-containing protein [Gemmatimonadales bacterium]|nr:double zinc ribbon domain-containing protein [Gemmatimonadales bacterium]